MTDTAKSDVRLVLVLGVGNLMKGDDGVGPFVATLLSTGTAADTVPREAGTRVEAIDCGTTPENHTSAIRRIHPDVLLIVDAAEMGLAPGECRVIPVDRAGALGLSTHSMPLSLFASYVREIVDEIVLVGVQPRAMCFGQGLSEEVREAGNRLAATIRRSGLDEVEVLD